MVSLLEKDNVRFVLPGLSLPLGKNGDYLVNHFKQKYDINIEYLVQTKTKSGKGTKSSRIDQIFNVKNESMDKFDKIKTKIGALSVPEIVKRNEHHLYIERVYLFYFKDAETKMVNSGEVSNEDVYKPVFK